MTKEERKEGKSLLRGGGVLGDAARDRIHLAERVDAAALFLELGELVAGELEAARHLDGHQVDEFRVDQDLVVAMRTGRVAARADIADHLALLDADAGLEPV